MHLADFSFGQWLLLTQYEILLFVAVFFALGALDEFLIDLAYLWLRLTGRLPKVTLPEDAIAAQELSGPVAVFIPAWQEAKVIGATLRHATSVWPYAELRIYVGCYANDPATIAAVRAVNTSDPRIRLVVNQRPGPTCKADCLNRLHATLCEDERASGKESRLVVLHDAEDMVDPAELALFDAAMTDADFVQIPVLALPRAGSRWIAGHYTDEFAQAHARDLVVRDALRAAIPGAGVGSAIARPALARLCDRREGAPFAQDSLTEDYQLGLEIARDGTRSRFLRAHTPDGRLIATRAFFPERIDRAVRQKTRWIHGIALQSWDRLGWNGRWVDAWMLLRDRRGPLAAVLLTLAYALIAVAVAMQIAASLGWVAAPQVTSAVAALLIFNLLALMLRLVTRCAFTTMEHGWRQGLFAILRMIVSNVIAIMAGWRALRNYARTLRGAPVRWDKTEHHDHPVLAIARGDTAW